MIENMPSLCLLLYAQSIMHRPEPKKNKRKKGKKERKKKSENEYDKRKTPKAPTFYKYIYTHKHVDH